MRMNFSRRPRLVRSVLAVALLAVATISVVPRVPAAHGRALTTIDAGGPYYGAPGSPVNFSATIGSPPLLAYSIKWTFGDGFTGTGGSVSHAYAAPGAYAISVEVRGILPPTLYASDTSTAYISTIEANGPYTGSVGVPVTFTATVTSPPPGAYTIHWLFGDGGSANGGVVSHAYAAPAGYTATVQLVKGGVIASDMAAVTITAATTIEAGGPYMGAVGTAITFIATVSNPPPAYTVSWNFGDGVSADGAIVSHAYVTSGVYSVTATVFQGAVAVATDGTTAVISAGATTIEAGGPYSGTAGSAIAFTAVVSNPPAAYTVTWTFGDGTSATGASVTHVYAAAGTYSVTATVYQGALAIASDSSTATVGGGAPPSVEADGPYSGVAGLPIAFNAIVNNPPPGYSVSWSFGDGVSGAGPSASHTYSAAGTYTAIVTVYQGGMAIVSDSTAVTVLPALPPGPAVTYQAGWNIVAGPAGMSFPQAAGPLYTYQAGDTAYQVLPNTAGVVGGRGYWAYFTAPTTVALSGAGALTAAIPAPANHWVMVGNPNGLTTMRVFGADLVVRWDPTSGSYVPADSLAPGQGAWAISVNGGTISVGP